MTPKVPKGWTVRGNLPKVELDSATDIQLDLLDEDLVQVRDPSGSYALDVGWYPAASKNGQFVCRLVRADDWDSPVEQLETTNREVVRRWLKRGVEEIQTRIGTPGEFSARIGLFIFVKRGRNQKAAKARPKPLAISPTISSPTQTHRDARSSASTINSSTTTPWRVQPELRHAA